MLQSFVFDGESRKVRWESTNSPLTLRVGDRVYQVVHHRPGFCLLEDGRCLRYSCSSSSGSHWTVSLDGQPIVAQLIRAQDLTAQGGQQGGLAKSPMNGVVVKVEVEAGQAIEAGQVVLVLEAMKMENEVAASVSGRLVRVEVKAGQVVTANQLLFEVQA